MKEVVVDTEKSYANKSGWNISKRFVKKTIYHIPIFFCTSFQVGGLVISRADSRAISIPSFMYWICCKQNCLLHRAKYTSVCCCDIASYKASYKSFMSKNLDEGVRDFLRPNTLALRIFVLLCDKMFTKKEYGRTRRGTIYWYLEMVQVGNGAKDSNSSSSRERPSSFLHPMENVWRQELNKTKITEISSSLPLAW
jgi:hypothetical protein